MWNKDGTFTSRSRPKSSGGGKQSFHAFGWSDESPEDPTNPDNFEKDNENVPCAAGISTKDSKDISTPCPKPGAHSRHREAMESNIFSNEPLVLAKQVSASKQRELSGNASVLEASNTQSTREISQAKRDSLYGSNVFQGDAEVEIKTGKVSEQKMKSLEGSQSQAILTGSDTSLPDRRPIRGGTKEPGGGSHITFGESVNDAVRAGGVTPGGQSIIQFG